MTKRVNEIIFVLILVGAFTGCAGRGQLNGTISAPGEPTEQVRLDFKPKVIGNGGRLSTTLPSGESFTGEYIEIITPTWTGLGPYDDPDVKGSDGRFLITQYSHEVVATLSSDDGKKVACRFILRDLYEGLRGTGAGECLSPEGKIEVR